MTVSVCDLRDNNECQPIGSAETNFKITGKDEVIYFLAIVFHRCTCIYL